MAKRILIVEDDKILNKLLVNQVKSCGYDAAGKIDWKQAKAFLNEQEPDLIILDDQLPDAKGSELVPDLSPYYPVVMLTAFGSVRDAVKAIRSGASDYLIKPIDTEELELVIKRVLDTEVLRANIQFYKQQSKGRGKKLLIGHSKALAAVEQMIDAVAPSSMTVLINGESGVGKELVAQELHERSDRFDKNFVALDCCTIQESLFVSELFGYENGAFTGADRRKQGLIETAEGGTLFLDEIGEIAPAIQVKLLRMLETGKFRRVGGTSDISSDVRILAATNRNLEQMVEEGTFRQDLLYRLNAFTIVMPPLRDRREDISELCQHFIVNHDFSRRIVKRVNPTAMRRLTAYDWPGNVRELRNVIERAIILSRDRPEIMSEHLAFFGSEMPVPEDNSYPPFEEEMSMAELEKHYLTHLLNKHAGHRGKVAQIMQISERNIYRLIKKYEL
jgi:DNA-binding NtrC family response regulator